VSGDGHFAGSVSASALSAAMTDRWTCVDPAGNPFDAERTVTLSLQKRTT
jgi:hypothetical protein